jgi:hypothetical protein
MCGSEVPQAPLGWHPKFHQEVTGPEAGKPYEFGGGVAAPLYEEI